MTNENVSFQSLLASQRRLLMQIKEEEKMGQLQEILDGHQDLDGTSKLNIMPLPLNRDTRSSNGIDGVELLTSISANSSDSCHSSSISSIDLTEEPKFQVESSFPTNPIRVVPTEEHISDYLDSILIHKKNRIRKRKSKKESFLKNVDKDFKVKAKRLVAALETSAQSQKEIQTWDREMGLKGSHSKTMTKSKHSRKKLQDVYAIFRGEERRKII